MDALEDFPGYELKCVRKRQKNPQKHLCGFKLEINLESRVLTSKSVLIWRKNDLIWKNQKKKTGKVPFQGVLGTMYETFLLMANFQLSLIYPRELRRTYQAVTRGETVRKVLRQVQQRSTQYVAQ